MIIDTHAHIYLQEFTDDFEEMLKRAEDAGVYRIVCPGTDVASSRESVALADRYPMVYACVGIHPHEAGKVDDGSLTTIESLSFHPKVVAIGEIGLDYHYNFSTPEIQRQIFRDQIDIAIRRDLPIVIHSREAEDDSSLIVTEKTTSTPAWRSNVGGEQRPKGVFHCFPGDANMAKRVIALGYCISIPGPVTFKARPDKPNTMAGTVAATSIQHILLETDSPYLAPVPLRGKRNEPAHITYIVRKVAELKSVSEDEVRNQTTKNAQRLFGFDLL